MLQQLKQQIDQCMAADVLRLQMHYRQLVQRQSAGKTIEQGLARLSQRIETSLKQSEQRHSGLLDFLLNMFGIELVIVIRIKRVQVNAGRNN